MTCSFQLGPSNQEIINGNILVLGTVSSNLHFLSFFHTFRSAHSLSLQGQRHGGIQQNKYEGGIQLELETNTSNNSHVGAQCVGGSAHFSVQNCLVYLRCNKTPKTLTQF